MRLVVTTPTEVIEDVIDIRSVRAEDATGAFGIQPGHADFVTVLPVSIVTWRDASREGHVVVRGGVLTMQGGDRIDIAARGAWRDDQLAKLGSSALAHLQRADEEEDIARKSEQRFHLATVRQIERLMRDDHQARSTAPRIESRASQDGQEARG
jgi:F-type H+-transporting ATPase subunit epsilon